MRFLTTIVAGFLALGISAQEEPITSPFYLTAIIDGEEQATAVVPVSRGVPILTPWGKYTQLFTYNTDTKRIYPIDEPNLGSFQLDAGSPVIFSTDEPVEDSELEQFGEDGAIYLIKEGTSDQGTQGWRTNKVDTNSTLPTNVFWPGQGSEEANTKLRIDLKAPSS